MAKEYVENLSALIAQVRPKLPRGKALEVKHFFGGAAAYVDGSIFMSLTKVGLGLKLPEEDREQLFQSKQAKKLRYFPKAPIKKQYALFPKGFSDDRTAKTWIETSAAFALMSKST